MEEQVFESGVSDASIYKLAERNLKTLVPLIIANGIIMVVTAPFFVMHIFSGKSFLNLFPALIYLIFGIWHLQAAAGLDRFLKNKEGKDMLRFSDRIAFYFLIQGILLIVFAIIIMIIIVANF